MSDRRRVGALDDLSPTARTVFRDLQTADTPAAAESVIRALLALPESDSLALGRILLPDLREWEQVTRDAVVEAETVLNLCRAQHGQVKGLIARLEA